MKVIIDRRKSERRGRTGGEGAEQQQREIARPPAPARAWRVPPDRLERRRARVKVVVHVDGGARGNPGPAAAAAVVSTPDGEVLDEATEFIGTATNNVAEYRGLLLGLATARRWAPPRSRWSTTPS